MDPLKIGGLKNKSISTKYMFFQTIYLPLTKYNSITISSQAIANSLRIAYTYKLLTSYFKSDILFDRGKIYEKVVFHMTISFRIDDELLREIDIEAKKLHLTRSSYITQALAQKMKNDRIAEKLLTEAMRISINSQDLQLKLE